MHEVNEAKAKAFLGIVFGLCIVIAMVYHYFKEEVVDNYPEIQMSEYHDEVVARQFDKSELSRLLYDAGISSIKVKLNDGAADCSKMTMSIIQGKVNPRPAVYERSFEDVSNWPKAGNECVSIVRMGRSVTMGNYTYHLSMDSDSAESDTPVEPIKMAEFINTIGNHTLGILAEKSAREQEIYKAFEVEQ